MRRGEQKLALLGDHEQRQRRADLVRDYRSDNGARPSGLQIALAHRRVDVRAFNADIRSGLQERDKLAKGDEERWHAWARGRLPHQRRRAIYLPNYIDWGLQGCGRGRIPTPCQYVEDHLRRADVLIERLLAGSLNGGQIVGWNTAEDGHQLPITVMDALQQSAM